MKKFIDSVFIVSSGITLLLLVAVSSCHFGYKQGIHDKVTIIGEKYKVTLAEKKEGK